MVGMAPPHSDEVIALSIIDFFTGAVLTNTLVQPPTTATATARVADWRTRITGVGPVTMASAVAEGRVLRGGREGARAVLERFVDAGTVIVGHAVKHDLKALGVVHHGRVVDSAVLAGEAGLEACGGGPGGEEDWGADGK
jgi:hypothetical protein